MAFHQWFRILRARWLIILLTAVGVSTGALAVASRLPKVYSGKARIMVELATDPITGAKIEPRAFESVVATQTALIQDPSVVIRAAQIMGYLNPGAATTVAETRARERLAQSLGKAIFVTNVPDSNLIDIAAFTNSRESAQKLAEAMRAAYVELSIQQQRSSAIGALQIMQDQMKLFLKLRSDASQRRTAFERQHDVILHEDGGSEDADHVAQIANADQNALAKLAGRQSTSNAVARNAVGLARIDAALATARATLGPNHPQVHALEAQRSAAAVNVQAPIRMANSTVTVDSLMSHQVERMLADRGVLAEGRMLVTQEFAYDNLLRGLASRIVTTAQQANVVNSGVVPVGAPNSSPKPVAPNFIVIGIVAVVIGLILGAELAIIVELLNRRVRGVEDLATFGVPMLTSGRQGEDREEAVVPELVAAA